MDLALDGLMIEIHPNPDDALSDAAQQITPARLTALLDRLANYLERADPEGHPDQLECRPRGLGFY
jgi:3-deoxy-D-arabino-heptulosonate 7-phosphate (DAHP) synthase